MKRRIILRGEEQVDTAIEAIRAAGYGGDPLTEVVLQPHRTQRTLAQNDCSWALYSVIGNHLGYTPQEIHDLALEEYAGTTDVEITDKRGKVHRVRRFNKTTSQMGIAEMSNFIDWLIYWGQQLIEGDLRPVAADHGWEP